MAKHYYNIEIIVDDMLDEDDIADLEGSVENSIRTSADCVLWRITTEYVDSEDK